MPGDRPPLTSDLVGGVVQAGVDPALEDIAVVAV
jgi:hypothetical protein